VAISLRGEGCALVIGPRGPIADTGDNIRELTEQAAAYSGGRTKREESRESPSSKLCWLSFSRSGRPTQDFAAVGFACSGVAALAGAWCDRRRKHSAKMDPREGRCR
jgi:hypothetical protein